MNMRFFYGAGRIIFLVVALANIYTLVTTFKFLGYGEIVSNIMMTLFYFLLAYMFHYNFRSMKELEPIEEAQADEMIEEGFKDG